VAKCCSKCSLCIMYCHRDVNCLSSAFDHVQGLGYQLCILYTQTHTVSARPSITSRDSAISSVSCTHRHTPSQLGLQSRPGTRLSALCPVHTDTHHLSSAFNHVQGLGYQLRVLYTQTGATNNDHQHFDDDDYYYRNYNAACVSVIL